MRERFDQFAKGLLRTVLTAAGEVRTEEEIVSEVQAADVWFVPAAGRAAERARLGLLGHMAETPCLLVVLRDLPATRETLPLRLLGAGPTFCQAVEELRALPAKAWEASLLIPQLLAFNPQIFQDLQEGSAEEIAAVVLGRGSANATSPAG